MCKMTPSRVVRVYGPFVAFLVLNYSAQPSDSVCIVPEKPFQTIRNSSESVQKLIKMFTTQDEKGRTFQEMAKFADRFDNRMVGTPDLERSIDYLLERFKLDRYQDVHTEDVQAVRWQRKRELAQLVKPERKDLHIFGLGGSVATPPGGLTAPLIVVHSFEQIQIRSLNLNGKIVLYLPEWKGPRNYASYLLQGTTEAAKQGARACLFRAPEPLTGAALYAGLVQYDKSAPRIPAAVLTKQDSDLLSRMFERGEHVQVALKLEPGPLEQVTTRNIVVEWRGSRYPAQYILVGAHVDSWDIGQGAADNAAGVFVAWRALSTLKRLGMRPKRTVRYVVWTAREQGMLGASAFFKRYAADAVDTVLALELDFTAFPPSGLTLSQWVHNDTVCIMREMLKEFDPIDASGLARGEEGSPELEEWLRAGVPVASVTTHWQKHTELMRHTEADTVSSIQREHMDLCTAFVAGFIHMLGELDQKLPR
ncbi:carboxypeptidase Q-like [Ornithodoros turicata]|uniref:carboxypeptidase Q-like n=1 Tax=Ornithodoros turicata TaxID=34597 RepID=UPI00313A465B